MSADSSASISITVGIATAGRRAMLSNTLGQLAAQQRLPDELIVCPSTPEDCDEAGLKALPYAARVVRGRMGSSAQRNAILDQCGDCDVVVFFDDDFYPAPDYLARVERIFVSEPSLVGITGQVLVDGAISQGVEHAAALAILAAHPPAPREDSGLQDVYNLYGCNMAVRMWSVRSHHVRFDENLPLYGWLEDVDFTRQLARHGRLAKSSALAGVHLATKRGRSTGVRVGYSQVANPWYLMRKGTLAPRRAFRQVWRNLAANAYRSFNPEPWVDRRGRLRGNAIAALDLCRGRLHPRNIVALRC